MHLRLSYLNRRKVTRLWFVVVQIVQTKISKLKMVGCLHVPWLFTVFTEFLEMVEMFVK